jgi:hypothetical protein
LSIEFSMSRLVVWITGIGVLRQKWGQGLSWAEIPDTYGAARKRGGSREGLPHFCRELLIHFLSRPYRVGLRSTIHAPGRPA